MSESATLDNLAARAATRNMRAADVPVMPADLEAAARRRIAEGPGSLRELREAALASLAKVGLPQSGSEDYTFLRTGDLLPHLSAVPDASEAGRGAAMPKTQTMPTLDLVRSLIFPESRESYLVLLDGEYAPGLSHPGPGYKVGPLEAALPAAGPADAAFRARLLALAARESDAPACLAMLFAAQPLLVQVAAKEIPAAPLQVLHLSSAALPARRDIFLVLAAGRLSESRVLVRHAEASPDGAPVEPKGGMSNVFTALLLEEGSSIKWLEAGPEGPRSEAEVHLHKLSAAVARDARVAVASTSTGSRIARTAFAVDLEGPGADATLDGATVLGGTRQAHRFVQFRHLAPNCTSRQHFKTVAADRGRASVDGTIFVAEGAQLTNAQQLINNLMLSDEARADSKPRLLIHADDVKCAHGATSGKLDPAQQFYLESRGLPAAQARTLMTLAFIAEVVDRVERAEGVKVAKGSTGFRAHLEQTLMDTLRRRLADAPTAAAAASAKGAA